MTLYKTLMDYKCNINKIIKNAVLFIPLLFVYCWGEQNNYIILNTREKNLNVYFNVRMYFVLE